MIMSQASCAGRPLIIVDGAPGLAQALAAVRNGEPLQRCTLLKLRNLLAHAPIGIHGPRSDSLCLIVSFQTDTRRVL